MDYINAQTKQILPLKQVSVLLGASVSLGEPAGEWQPIKPSDPPAAGSGQIVEPASPVQVDGDWFYGWTVRDKTADELATDIAQARERFKASRAEAVAAITVTTQVGNTFDGDEISQGRMARAILGLQATGEGAVVPWVLVDNSVVQVNAAELLEALTLAGLRQAELWIGEP